MEQINSTARKSFLPNFRIWNRLSKKFQRVIFLVIIFAQSSCLPGLPDPNLIYLSILPLLNRQTNVTDQAVAGNPVLPPSQSPPILSYLSSPFALTIHTPTTIVPTISGSIMNCSVLPSLPIGLNLGAGDCSISGTPTFLQSTTNYTITATNSFGSTDISISITVNQAPPTLSYSGSPFSLALNSPIAIAAVTSGTIISCGSSPPLPTGLTIGGSSCNISGTPTVLQPSTAYTITATNSYGSSTATIFISVIGMPPTLSYLGSPFTLTVSSPFSIPATTSGTITSCGSSPALPTGLSLGATDCNITGTPTALQPLINYTITATNTFGSTPVNIGILINSSPPTLSYSGGPFSLGNHISSSIAAVTSGTITSCGSSPPLPTGLSIGATNCNITGIPTNLQAPTSYTITATNSSGSSTATISISIVRPIYAATSGGLSISTNEGLNFTNRTTAHGLGHNIVHGVYAVGANIYAATENGLAISNNGGASFTNRTTTNGLGDNFLYGVFADGTNIYVATWNGVSISTNGGLSFTNRTTSDGLGNNNTYGVFAVGLNVYVATGNGLSISSNGGGTFLNRTSAHGITNTSLFSVFVDGLNVYAATGGGLAISNDGGLSFVNRTTANGLGSNTVYGVNANGSTVYVATWNRFSRSTNGGTSFTNRNTTHGLGSNNLYGVFSIGMNVYAATGGGLSISTNGGTSFTNRTVGDGLGNNLVNGVFVQ